MENLVNKPSSYQLTQRTGHKKQHWRLSLKTVWYEQRIHRFREEVDQRGRGQTMQVRHMRVIGVRGHREVEEEEQRIQRQ